ncbi:MAG: hypothetical protein LBT00_07250 [Spirochaetaceae bacterium]|nr:hypothetical protein [Spirochaetaceae bacterium]
MRNVRKTTNIPVGRRRPRELPETTVGQTATGKADLFPLTEDTGTSGIIEKLKAEAAEKTARRKREGRKPFEGLYGCFEEIGGLQNRGSPEDCGSLEDCYAVEDDPVMFVMECRGEWPDPWEDSI